jgi:hypothetical protein
LKSGSTSDGNQQTLDNHHFLVPAIASPNRPCAEPSGASKLDAANREALLRAIAKAQSWVDRIVSGRIGSFEDIARAENLAER